MNLPLAGILLFCAAGLLWMGLLLADGLRRRLMAAWAAHTDRRKRRPMTLRVTTRLDIAEDLVILRLAPQGGGRLPGFRPGQFLPLNVQASPGEPALKRCYSIAAWCRRPQYYELCIKRCTGGLISPWLHREIEVGKTLSTLSPRGSFVLDPQAGRDIVLVAGGVGIAPLRAMLNYAMSQRFGRLAKVPLILFYAARYREHLCYHDEFVALENAHPRFHFHPVLSKPDAQWQGLRGHLTASTVLDSIPNKDRAGFYLCSPPAMLDTLVDGLRSAGVANDRIFYERFGLTGAVDEDLTFRIEIAQGKAFWFSGQRTLLDALEAHGVGVENECRTGECGACKIHLIEGQVQELAQPGVTLGRDEILPCCCIPRSDLRLSGCTN